MSGCAVASATTILGYVPKSPEYAANTAREIVIVADDARDCAFASEKSLECIWMTQEEEEAWKDL